jgi:predicted ATPase
MALRKIIETEGNAVVQTPIGVVENGVQRVSFLAYIKVISVQGTKESVTAQVEFKNNNQKIVKNYTVPVSVADGSTNFIAQAYVHLKTLEEFAGATDC